MNLKQISEVAHRLPHLSYIVTFCTSHSEARSKAKVPAWQCRRGQALKNVHYCACSETQAFLGDLILAALSSRHLDLIFVQLFRLDSLNKQKLVWALKYFLNIYFSWTSCNFHHHICWEYVWGEKHPKYIIYEKSNEKECGDLKTRQSNESNECNTQSDAHKVHQDPASSHHPNAHNSYGQCKTKQLSCRKSSTKSQRHSIAIAAWTN